MADNTITIVGNITRDPELKFLNSGQAALRLAVAVSRKWTNRQTNEQQEQTSYFDIQAYGSLAENCANSLQKGSRVVVTGRMEQRSYEDKDGNKRSAFEIVADEIAPSLRWATAAVTRTPRADGGASYPSNGGSSYQPSAAPATPQYTYDEEPF
jgi:single-strand DNA-binding protein